MTVDSHNIEAVSSRTKPTKKFLPHSFAESVLSCPSCGNSMEPLLLGFKEDGSQQVWWTCSEVKNKKCSFPLNMPTEIFWVTRSVQDIEKNEVPPPNLSNLPIRYQHLYPSLFQYARKTPHDSRQGSHESTRSISSGPSDTTGSTSSAWDVDETAKSRTAIRLEAMRKPKVMTSQTKTFIPSLTGSRTMAIIESMHQKEASTSIQSRLKLGRGEKKISDEQRDAAKKKVIQMLSKMNPSTFKHLAPMQVQHMKKAVIEHVKKRRAEREELAELQRINDKRNKVVDVDDLIKAKLAKNKKKYEERRIELARQARLEAARKSRLAGVAQSSLPSMPGYGYEEEEDGEGQQHAHATAPYAVTPTYVTGGGSPESSTSSFYQSDSTFSREYDYVGEEFAGMDPMELDHSGEVPSYGEDGEAGSPFAELGPLTEDDLEGIVNDPTFEDTFATAFGEDFADLSHYN